ncbi:Dna2/Cas4 domain-containing protein [Micromonospora sp. NPDC005173]|uniref:CRISPR-associated protein Cas4 n=1 Tax=Micromonospora sp. NPDC005173 TaxID=3157165 RepID=UPI0033AE8261
MTPTTDGDGARVEIPLSALEHYAYCHRQTALIHIEGIWGDSAQTVRGDLSHRLVDLPGLTRRAGLTIIRSLPVSSGDHGLRGICDVVEFVGTTATPVEYKVGRYQPDGPADLQLAGQALCLLESGFDVSVGYIYSVAERRRHPVTINPDLLPKWCTRPKPSGASSRPNAYPPRATTPAAANAHYATTAYRT